MDRYPIATGMLLAALFALAFAPGLTGPFLLDDWGNLEPLLGVSFDLTSTYGAIFSNPSGLLHRPISNLTFVANLLTTGVDPLAFKLTNLVIHAITGVATFLVTQQILSTLLPESDRRERQLAAAITSAIWMIHPLQVSTVLYVVQRMAMLSALFSLVAVGAALAAIDRGEIRRSALVTGIVLFLLASALALLSKENGVLTPLLLGTVLLIAPKPLAGLETKRRRTLWIALVFVPIGLGLCAAAVLWAPMIGGFSGRPFSLAERLLTQPAVLAGYIGTIFFPAPSGMALFRDDTVIRHVADWSGWSFLAAWILATITAIRFRHRCPLVSFAVLWFLACHALESSFLPLELAFEHRNYLALLGPAILVGGKLAQWSRRMAFPSALAVVLFPVVTLFALTLMRSVDWSSEESFAESEVARRPDSVRAQNLMAIIERRAGNTEAPILRMARMKALYPDEFFPWAMDMDFACDLPEHAVDWQRIRDSALRSPGSPEVLGYFNHITLKVIGNHCAGIDASSFGNQLERLEQATRQTGSVRASQYFLLLRASLLESSDVTAARGLFHSALAQTPEATDILERVALFELRHGTPEQATMLLNRLDALTPDASPRQSRVAELREEVSRMVGSN